MLLLPWLLQPLPLRIMGDHAPLRLLGGKGGGRRLLLLLLLLQRLLLLALGNRVLVGLLARTRRKLRLPPARPLPRHTALQAAGWHQLLWRTTAAQRRLRWLMLRLLELLRRPRHAVCRLVAPAGGMVTQAAAETCRITRLKSALLVRPQLRRQLGS